MYRKEEDACGVIHVPTAAYYGGQTMRAQANFPISGQTLHPDVIHAFGMIKQAAAQANEAAGLLSPARAEPIRLAAAEVARGDWDSEFILDPIQGGAGTSSNMNANEVIANRALELSGEAKGAYDVISPTTHVNMSQSTNDVFPTANRLAMLRLVDVLQTEMHALHASLLSKAEAFAGHVKMGRTHLQDAVPIRLGQEFAAYAAVLARDITRIEQAATGLSEVNMGGTAVGTGLNADADYTWQVVRDLSAISGFTLRPAANLIDATQNTDTYTTLSAMLKICMVNMSKMANDLRLMSSGPKTGLAEISLPSRQAGSSIMPGKVNPVMAEVLNQVAFQVMGNDHTVALASEAGQFELNVMEPVLVHNVIDSLSIMANGFRVFRTRCVDGITANTDQLADYTEQSLGVLTAINPHIGYEQASAIAAEALATGQTVRETCLRHGLLTEAELDQILDPASMTEPGISASHLLDD